MKLVGFLICVFFLAALTVNIRIQITQGYLELNRLDQKRVRLFEKKQKLLALKAKLYSPKNLQMLSEQKFHLQPIQPGQKITLHQEP